MKFKMELNGQDLRGINIRNYDIDTAREIVIAWFLCKVKSDFTSDDVADILDGYETSEFSELEKYLESITQ